MKLPQELIDEIFSHLTEDDEKTLRACSLVAKSWVYPAQRLLFSSIAFNTSNFQSWRKRIRPKQAGLLNHVRSLHYWTPNPKLRSLSSSRIDGPFRYLPSFRQLRTLILSDMYAEPDISLQVKTFSAFRHTLSSLSLQGMYLRWDEFILVVDYFSNLKNLDIRWPHFSIGGNQELTSLSRPLCGELSIAEFGDAALVFFSEKLAGALVGFEELTMSVNQSSLPMTECYQSIIDEFGKSLQRLNLHPENCLLDLSVCSKLCRLEFHATSPGETERSIISSITSRSIHTIAFTSKDPFKTSDLPLDDPPMQSLDDVMRGLVDRLCSKGCRQTLVLEFRSPSVIFDRALDSGKYFPNFREKGRVVVVAASNGKAVELS